MASPIVDRSAGEIPLNAYKLPDRYVLPDRYKILDRWRLLLRLQILAGIGCFLIVLYSLRFWASGEVARIIGVGILVAGAALASGFLVGFIFGIPRVGGERREPFKSRPLVCNPIQRR